MLDSSSNSVDQRRAAPGGDAVGRDKVSIENAHFVERRSQIDGWLDKLAEQMKGNPEVRDFVDSIQYYFQPQPYDEIVGLEAKLDHSGRSGQKFSALRKKEAFSKLLEEWRAYPAAQEIIAYFLSKVENCFETDIVPHLKGGAPDVIDEMIRSKLINPVLQEMGCGPFMLNYNNVSGMIYWLAEQCYIRWHA